MDVEVRDFVPGDEYAYAYLLGMYLGDGCVSENRRGGVLMRVTLDCAYPRVIDDCVAAMQMTMLDARVSLLSPQDSYVVVQSCGRRWLLALPQHGPGPKHERPIVLEPWQEEIVDRQREAFVSGLIHSDGCRTINRFATKLPSGRVAEYAYPRYFFSNLSADIRGLFCSSCDALGVRWTKSNARNISVSHRDSVAILDEIGCTKE